MATTFQTLKETMHARLTTGARPPPTPGNGSSEAPTSAVSWKGLNMFNEATSIIGQAVRSLVNTVGQTLISDDFPADIDGTYISPRILVIGPPRKKLAERDRFRNDPERIRELVCQRHGTFFNTMCFDLAPNQSGLDVNGMRKSVVQFDLDRPTLECLREACAAIVSWLDADDQNVAIITCSNGIKSSCLVIACIWAELSGDSIRQGLCKFFEERMKLKKTYAELLQKLPPSYDRLLKTYEREKIYNENMECPLELVELVFRRAPFVPDGDANIAAAFGKPPPPKLLIRTGPSLRRVERMIVPTSRETEEFSESEGTWRIDLSGAPLIISGDVALDLVTTSGMTEAILLSFPFQVGALEAGKIVFGPNDMDELRRHILPGDFELEMTLKDVERLVEDASFAQVKPCGKELCSVRHIVRPNKQLVSELMGNFPNVTERDAEFSLQRTNNDYIRASQLLTKQNNLVVVSSKDYQEAFENYDGFGQAFPSAGISGQKPGKSTRPVLATLDGNSGKKSSRNLGSAKKTSLTPVNTPLKRKQRNLDGGDDDYDPTLSPFLRETIGRGLSSPMTPSRGDVREEDAVGEMDRVLIAQLAQLLQSDSTLVTKVEKLAEGKAAIVELDKLPPQSTSIASFAPQCQISLDDPRRIDFSANAPLTPGLKPADNVAPTPAPLTSVVSVPVQKIESDNASLKEETAGNQELTIGKHENYGVFFKMLKMGVPRSAVEQKMRRDGFNVKALDLGANAAMSKLEELERAGQKTLGEDETYSKYFRMLKMGVPHLAVQQRMDKDGVHREALELGENAPFSKLEEILKTKSSASTPAQKTKPVKPKTFRWDAIPEERLQKGATIWHHDDVKMDDFQITNDLEMLFVPKVDPSDVAKATTANTHKLTKVAETKKKSVVDPRRAQSICIGLAKLKMSTEEYVSALNNMDETILTSPVMQVVQGCSLFPSADEQSSLMRLPTNAQLAEPDEFLLQVARGCPDASGRVEALYFRYLFEEIAVQCKDGADQLRDACGQVRKSDSLKNLLRIVLVIGNQINTRGEADENNKVKAFTLASLLKLSQTKSVNKTTTVLEYLVQFIMTKMPQVLVVADELSIVNVAKRIDLAALTRQYKDLKKGLDAVSQTYDGLRKFCTQASETVRAIDRSLLDARKAFDDVLDYFGEDPEMTTMDFFSILSSFLMSFAQAKKELVEREKRNARKKQQQQQMQERKPKMQQTTRNTMVNDVVAQVKRPPVPQTSSDETKKSTGGDAQQDPYPHLAEFLRNL